MIYLELLCNEHNCITNDSFGPGQKSTLVVDGFDIDIGIDASILRTCRLVYKEAISILYSSNTPDLNPFKNSA